MPLCPNMAFSSLNVLDSDVPVRSEEAGFMHINF